MSTPPRAPSPTTGLAELSGPAATPERLPRSAETRSPRHVAFIVDGNRRWARAHGCPVEQGHREGADNICRAVRWCEAVGIETTTWWLLSTDNLNRAAPELHTLLDVILELTHQLAAAGYWRMRHLGDPRLLPDALATALSEAQTSTCHNPGPQINFAVGYSGRQDILAAARLIADQAVTSAGFSVSEWSFAQALSTVGLPDPDLVIRTSGEQRLSGFMLWQAALSELYFCPTLWPDFTQSDLHRALAFYANRQRRFGK
ncbi:polyprenyl diphosphate synthase [Streptomyces sp. NPDC059009]|uniref:polyprenyl diphosphate synthase n=1 Tax=Streptomyces sp. NPDC059009 TaxID=3346694 RepID=UPI0036946614